MQTQITFPLMIPYIDESDSTTSTVDTITKPTNSAVVAALKMNLKEVELPLLLQALQRYLEKI